MAIKSQAGRRYALALVESLSTSQAISLDDALGQITLFEKAMRENFALENALLSPAITRDERDKVLEAVLSHLKIAPIVRSFMKLLVEKRRIGELADIADAFREIADKRRGRTRAVVHSASPLAPDQLDRLRRALEKSAGGSVEIESHVDPALIGGVRARVGSTVFDGTIRSELDRLRTQLSGAE